MMDYLFFYCQYASSIVCGFSDPGGERGTKTKRLWRFSWFPFSGHPVLLGVLWSQAADASTAAAAASG